MDPNMPAKTATEGPVVGRAKGGLARARSLSPEERTEISRAAAKARWDTSTPVAICGSVDKPLVIGDIEVECYVLEDGTRVLTQASFLRALGRHPKANTRKEKGDLPPILQGQALKPFVPDDIVEKSRPITFRPPSGGRASGYNAELLPAVCEVYLQARAEGALPYNQRRVAMQAEILVRGLARIGIIALVDEATGYQEVRAKDALARILEQFVAQELQPWVRTFPDDFYREMFRLRGLDFTEATINKRPQYFGVLTNDAVYQRLAPGVLDELKRQTPRTPKGQLRDRLHQRLTPDMGHPKLKEHLASVVTIMKLSRDWDDFKVKVDQIHPRFGQTVIPMEIAPSGSDGD